MASIIHQVKQCVDAVDRIGVSKKGARENGIKAIHSHKTKSEVLKIGKQFARYVRDGYGIKNLHDITEQHYIDFMGSKSDTTLDYRRGIETNLRLLQEGLHKRSERFEKEPVVFVTEKRLIGSRGRMEGVSDRSYTESEMRAIQERVSPSVARSIGLMYKLGLRVGESVQLCVRHVQDDYIRIQDESITKGGRDRLIPIPDSFKGELEWMSLGKGAMERLVPLSEGTVMNAVTTACKELKIQSNGTHGFRHSYARGRVDQLMTPAEKTMFANCMERYAENKPFDYGVHDREIYDAMKAKMDIVHGELGHGKDRFDLAVRYMR